MPALAPSPLEAQRFAAVMYFINRDGMAKVTVYAGQGDAFSRKATVSGRKVTEFAVSVRGRVTPVNPPATLFARRPIMYPRGKSGRAS
jgi:hypothetical protein